MNEFIVLTGIKTVVQKCKVICSEFAFRTYKNCKPELHKAFEFFTTMMVQ